jgi:phage repressor protein C with HTH and peptisase S24 domain
MTRSSTRKPQKALKRANEGAEPRGIHRLLDPAVPGPIGKENFAVAPLDGKFTTRLKAVVDLFSTQKEAASFIGRSPVTLQNWAKGAEPSFSDVTRLAVEKGVSLRWLATGEGEMLGGPAPGDFAYIPRYEVRAGAGFGQPVLSEEVQGFLAFRQDWIRQRLRRNPANLVVIEAFGDSMQPTISDGDVMLVDISEDRVRGSAIYVVGAGNEAVVKRVELRLDGSLLVKSDNPSYEPIILPRDDADELRVIGKVVWSGGLV